MTKGLWRSLMTLFVLLYQSDKNIQVFEKGGGGASDVKLSGLSQLIELNSGLETRFVGILIW